MGDKRISELSRIEKERLLEAKLQELQEVWHTPMRDSFAESRLNDNQLDQLLAQTVRRIRVEKVMRAFVYGVSAASLLVGVLAVLSLLVFGIKQLFFRH
jgi:hypothetical protein